MSAPASESNRRILIIDDNPAIHADFRKILAKQSVGQSDFARATAELFGGADVPPAHAGFEMESASQGQEGLAAVEAALAKGQRFALAFVDVRMPPGWDGIETANRLWAVDPNLQIVICTAYSDYSWTDMAARLGSTDRWVILKKPFDAVEILQLSSALAEKSRLALEARRRLEDLDAKVRQRTAELIVTNGKLQDDITQRKSVEEALRESEQRWSEIIDFLPDATFAIDNTGKVIAWNRAIEEMTQIKAVNMVGKGDYEYALPFYGDRRRVLLDLVLATDKSDGNTYRIIETEGDVLVAETDAKVRGKDRSLWVKARPLYNSKGEIVGAIETIRDITDRKDLETQFRQSQKMEAVGQLAAGVAHDFNNILTVIQGNAALLQTHNGVASVDPDSAVAEILRASQRAANLTRQLLTFSRRQLLQPKPLNLNDVVANMTQMLQRLIGEHISLEARYAPGSAPVHADPGMMEQILINLAVNSRDAMPNGGRLIIATSHASFNQMEIASRPTGRAGEFVHLAVSDSGCGIAPEHIARIFEPFFTTKDPGKGTGLGLATVFGIVTQHHGWIDVESTVNVGTTFHIYLHRLAHSVAKLIDNKDVRPPRGGDETILLVEDETSVRHLFRMVLERKGYRVHTADSGVAALDLWQQHQNSVDLLLTDMVMPEGISGRELAEKLVAAKPSLKVIYCSGYTDEMLGKDSRLRVDGNFLEKPFEPDKLLRRVRDCLDAVN